MKKKIILFSIIGLLMAGSAQAGSMWGNYNGQSVVRIQVDGETVDVDDVPAINYKGRTLVPVYLLGEAGLSYSYNATTKTVDIQSVEATIEDGNADPSEQPEATPEPTSTPEPSATPEPTPYVPPFQGLTNDQIQTCRSLDSSSPSYEAMGCSYYQ